MKKIIFIAVFFSFSVWAGTSDNINLSSVIDPVCEVSFDAEPVASNLDLTTSQTNLLVGRFANPNNTINSTLYQTNVQLDFVDHLTHASNPSYIFSFSNLKIINDTNDVFDPVPFGIVDSDNVGSSWQDVYLSYTGIPSLSLVQGTYSAEWFVSCSIEPRI